MILNEYGWLWLNRDGTPTLLTKTLYPKLLGSKNTTEHRFALEAYLLGGETEFWRAYRRYAGVLQFVYLTASEPKAFTSDSFLDVKTLTLEPHMAKTLEQAFNPLGVYLNFWHDCLPMSQSQYYTVTMVNDRDHQRGGRLRLSFLSTRGEEVNGTELAFQLAPLGAQTFTVQLASPSASGAFSLRATATADDDRNSPVSSERHVQ